MTITSRNALAIAEKAMDLHQAKKGIIILDIIYNSAYVNRTNESHYRAVGLSQTRSSWAWTNEFS